MQRKSCGPRQERALCLKRRSIVQDEVRAAPQLWAVEHVARAVGRMAGNEAQASRAVSRRALIPPTLYRYRTIHTACCSHLHLDTQP